MKYCKVFSPSLFFSFSFASSCLSLVQDKGEEKKKGGGGEIGRGRREGGGEGGGGSDCGIEEGI